MADATLHLEGGNNITLSTATAASVSSVTISGPNTHAQQTAISGISASDTVYTSGTVAFTGSGAVTVKSAAGQQVVIDAPVHTAQTGISSIVASDATYTSGSVQFTGSNMVTVKSSANQRVVIDATQTVQTQGGFVSLGVSTGGNTAGDTGVNTGQRLVIVGSNNITASQGTGAGSTTITLSGANTHAQQTGISSIAGSNTTYTAGLVEFTGSNIVTVRSSANSRIVIDASTSQSVQTQDVLSVGVSTGGNTAGNTTVNTGSRLVFSGQSNITLSQATAAGATTIGISGPDAGGVQSNLSVGVSTGGNTQGNTTVNTGQRLVFVGSDNITLSQATGAGSTTISISGPSPAAGTVMSIGVSTGGNTEGNTTVNAGSRMVFVGSNMISLSQATGANSTTITIKATQSVQTDGIAADRISVGVSSGGNTQGDTTVNSGSRLVFVGTNNITLSQATGAGSTTISISGPSGGAPTIDFFNNVGIGGVTNGIAALGKAGSHGSIAVHPLAPEAEIFPGNMTANTVLMKFTQSGSTATMSAAHTTSYYLGIYTRNVSSLSLLNSVSVSFGSNAGNANLSTQMVGDRWLTIHSSAWSVQPTFSQGHYWFATMYKTAGVSNQTFSQLGAVKYGSAMGSGSGTMGVATVATNTSQGFAPFYGIFSATSADLPASIGSAQLNKVVLAAQFNPMLLFQQNGPQSF